MQGGYKVAFSDRFKKDFKGLAPDIQKAVESCIIDFSKDPLPSSRRFHRINSGQFPKVYSVDVMSNKSYKISFQIDGMEVTLRRVATHKEIDRIN